MLISQSATAVSTKKVDYPRLLWAGPLAVLATVAANLTIRTILVAVLQAENFIPYQLTPVTIATVVGVTAGAVLFALMGRFAKHPVSTFRRVAKIGVLVSFVPDLLLLVASPFPGVNILTVGGLMLMHLPAAAACIYLLTALASNSER